MRLKSSVVSRRAWRSPVKLSVVELVTDNEFHMVGKVTKHRLIEQNYRHGNDFVKQ